MSESELFDGKVQRLRRALADLVSVINDSDQRPPREQTAMRMVSIVSGRKEHAIIDAARKTLEETA